VSRTHYSPAKTATRNKKFFEHLAQKNNPVRFLAALPPDVVLEDIDWNPSHLEEIAAKLADMKKCWEAEDDERRRKRLAEIMVALERDKVLLRLEAEQEHRLAQIQEYYRREHEKEAEAGDRSRREELAKVLKRINQDTCRLEREELTRRGVVRGRR